MESGHARCKMPDGLDLLLTSEISKAIEEANLGVVNAQIARRYYIDHAAHMDIAVELGYDRSTVSKRLKDIAPRVSRAAARLPPS